METWKRKDSLPRLTFQLSKPMVLTVKNIGFTAQELWFRTSKYMFLQPKTYAFSAKI